MSITVRHLNGDSTFLLLFSPEPYPSTSDLTSANGAYSVLIDPWITGSSIINAKWFAVTDRVEPSAISHLAELEEPDVVICSQNKPDHTHKETLLQLRPEGKTVIAAEPGAAKAIRSWNYFDPHRIVSLVKYDPRAKFGNSLRLHIPPLSFEGLPGELVISFIPAKNYVTGLHNAIGITYQPPTKTKSLAPVVTVDLPKHKYFHLPMTPTSAMSSSPPETSPVPPYCQVDLADSQETVVPVKRNSLRCSGHRPRLSRTTNTASSELLAFPYQPLVRPSMEDPQDPRMDLKPSHASDININDAATNSVNFTHMLPTPPDSPASPVHASIATSLYCDPLTPTSPGSSESRTSHSHSRQDSRKLSASNRPCNTYPARPKAVSVLYTPHGITMADVKPYVQKHLTRLPGALPLTLLLHSFEYAQNPWYFGGNIMTGAAGGMEIARALMARCWISAHDEQKEKRGVSVKLLKCEMMTAEEIRRELASDDDGRAHGWMCDVRVLPSGKELLLSGSERDLLVGSTFDGVRQGSKIDETMFQNEISVGGDG